MPHVTRAAEWTNGEVGYLAWAVSKALGTNYLGIMVTRIHETGADAGQRRTRLWALPVAYIPPPEKGIQGTRRQG